MLSRRLIRIKVFKVLYSRVMSDSMSVEEARKELLYSCEKTLDLYNFMLNLSVALHDLAEQKIETGLRKFKKTEADSNPNRKFVENRFIKYLMADEEFTKTCRERALTWNEDRQVFVKQFYSELITRDYYQEYMANPDSSLKEDCDLIRKIYTEEFEDNADLEALLEDETLFWMDDLGFVLNAIIRNIDFFRRKETLPKATVFIEKDDHGEDDRRFALNLIDASIMNYSRYLEMVTASVKNWDPDRIVNTDVVLIVQGLAEAVRFESIPVKVTINEYVEISKFYSTHKSKVFVNGLLDRLIQKMMQTGEIVKSGRGLME